MKTLAAPRLPLLLVILILILLSPAHAQLLINVDFGVGTASPKTGLAATGLGTNDFWNVYSHYSPRHLPGKPYQTNGFLEKLKLSDRSESAVSLGVTNAPGTWGNSSGDAMFDHFIFAHNGSNISLTLRGLEPGSYQFYLYGHADADSGPEQNSLFQLRTGTNVLGPLGPGSAPGWKVSQGWQEGRQFVVFRDVPVLAGEPVVITVAAGPGGVAVLNGLQILSRGTSPPKVFAQPAPVAPATYTNLIVREVRYDGKVTDTEARFTATVDVESLTTNEVSAILFEGDIAVFAPELPAGVRLTRAGDLQSPSLANDSSGRRLQTAGTRAGSYRLHCAKPGVHTLKLEVIARITKAEPWNNIAFVGPPAATASLKAEGNTGVEVELLSGALIEGATAKAGSAVAGVVGADRVVSLRWQSKTTEIARKSLITVDTTAAAQISPTVIKFTTQLRYELLQASAAKLNVTLPGGHTLTRVQGDGIRDWRVVPGPALGPVPGGGQAEPYFILTVEFAKPVEKTYALTLFTEVPVESTPVTMNLRVPQPLDIEREAGTFAVSADDTVVEVDSAPGLRQVNASTGTLFAWRFNARPFSVAARLRRIEPVLETAARVTARLEESRLVVSHAVNLSVLKAGIYTAEFSYPTNFNVTDVRGGNVEDWKATAGKLKVNFTQRVLGTHRLDLVLEQAHKTFPAQITVAPVRVTGATKETAFIGAASAAGIRLKTETLTSAREIPIAQLSQRAGDEALAFTADAPDWKLALATERLPARVMAEVFNLVTVGDGLVGGSATIRFGVLNQGVQEFKVRLPAHWKNVEFTGPNIRRKETPTTNGMIRVSGPTAPIVIPSPTQYVVWTISLQDKAWGGYTLVVTYDYQFDPKKAVLDLAGAHCDGVERETGSLAVTAAANLKLQPKPAAEPLRAIDPSELAETDRALCTRPVLLAWRYTGSDFALTADAARFDEERVLDAVADRTQITSVVTEAGEMLTQASFMVKNNDRQHQRFQLPPGAQFWGCYVNNQPSKAERDDKGWLVVPLPRGANRDEAFAVDLVYQQKLTALDKWLPQSVALTAPATDVPNTYAEWQLFVPTTKRVSSFGGTMTVARGTTYELADAWRLCKAHYVVFMHDNGGVVLFLLVVAIVICGAFVAGRRGGVKGLLRFAGLAAALAVLAAMSLPSFSGRVKYMESLGRGEVQFGAGRAREDDSFIEALKTLESHAKPDNSTTLADAPAESQTAIGGTFTSVNGQNRNRLTRMNLDGTSDSTVNPQVATPPAKPQLRAVQLERLAEVEKKMADWKEVESLAREESARKLDRFGVDAVEAKAKSAAGAKAKPESLVAGRFFRSTSPMAASGPMPATPPPAAMPAPAPRPVDPQGIPLALGTTTNSTHGLNLDVISVDGTASRGAFQLGGFAVGGLGGVGGGGGGGWAGREYAEASGEAAQVAAGMRSIRIDIPRSGQAFTFTKVLNLKSEPLGIELALMPLGKFRAAQSTGQLVLFIGGLLWAFLCWRSAERSSFGVALGVALAVAGVVWLGLSARTLHWVMIGAVPVVGGAALLWAAWRMWPKREVISVQSSVVSEAPVGSAPVAESRLSATDSGSGPVPPAAALLLFAFLTASQFTPSALGQQLPTNHSLLITPPSVTLTSASYVGTLREKSAEFTATLALTSTGTNQTFTLFGGDVAIQSFTAKSGEARLVREGATARVWLPKAGAVTVELKLLARLEGDATKRRLAFGLPPALASQFSAVIEEADADVEFPSAVAFKRTSAGKQTRVEAIIGSTDRVDLAWTPRLKRIAEMDATIFAQTATLVTVGGGVVNSRAVVDYQIAQGELRQAKVRLPAGQRLLRVEGEGVRTWELMAEGGAEVLTVDLLKGVTANWRLTIELEKTLGALPATVKVEVPIVQDVRRESGLVAVRGAEETSLAVETATDLQRVDNAEFNRASKLNVTDLVSAFRYLRSTFAFAVKAEAVQPQVDATVMQRLRVGAEELRLAAEVTYNVKKAGIFQLRAQVPVGWRIETVGVVDAALRQRGSAFGLVNNWTEKTEAGRRVLDVPLRERTQGQVSLLVILAQTLKEAPKALAVPAVHPLGVDKLNGFVAVSTEAGLSVKTESFDGLSEIPAATMPVGGYKGLSEQATLAFKFLVTEPSTTATWRLGIAAEQLESWVRAEVVNLISVTETLVSGRALVRLDIANAPVKEFRLKIPLSVTNVDITGANIRRRDQTGEVWRVELQNKLRGQHTFMVTWEQARAAKTNAPVDVPAVEAVGVERETGSVAILAKPPLQVSEKAKTGELLVADPRELPEWAAAYASGAKGEQVVLAWRYLRPGWKLAVTPQRFAEAAVLQALVDSARLTTVVADDGQMMTEVSLSVRNNGRQFLEVELPPGAMVWSAFVAGAPVRPTKQGGKLLLPLEQSAADAAVAVEFTYVAADKFPKRKGNVALASPKLDVPLKNARWELLLPPDYEYTDFAGSMGRDLTGAPVVTVNYSATEYDRQERRSKELRDTESKSSLGRLSGLLSSGNLNAANNEFFNYKRNLNNPAGNRGTQVGQAGKDMEADDFRQLKEVEVQLRRSQASNLVQAQQAYTLDNATKLGVQVDNYFAVPNDAKGAQVQVNQQALRYDTDAAEQQLEKLQKAQEVTVATVQPLRVNLPLRGQRHVFTQVLQTEVNKPMTVEFAARNQKSGGWLKPIALTLGAFLALWLAVAVFAERRRA